MAGPGRNGANDAMLIREVQADRYYIPLAVALSDSTHGTIRGFEVVTVRLRDTEGAEGVGDRKSTRLNSSHGYISYAVFCLKKKNKYKTKQHPRDTTH